MPMRLMHWGEGGFPTSIKTVDGVGQGGEFIQFRDLNM